MCLCQSQGWQIECETIWVRDSKSRLLCKKQFFSAHTHTRRTAWRRYPDMTPINRISFERAGDALALALLDPRVRVTSKPLHRCSFFLASRLFDTAMYLTANGTGGARPWQFVAVHALAALLYAVMSILFVCTARRQQYSNWRFTRKHTGAFTSMAQ